jgi:hypothetical protein
MILLKASGLCVCYGITGEGRIFYLNVRYREADFCRYPGKIRNNNMVTARQEEQIWACALNYLEHGRPRDVEHS